MNGVGAAADTSLATMAASWAVACDLDGDGKADILWRNADGAADLWIMVGPVVATDTGLGTILWHAVSVDLQHAAEAVKIGDRPFRLARLGRIG